MTDLSLGSIVSQMANLKAENDRLKRENAYLESARTCDKLSSDVVRFFINTLANGFKDYAKQRWIFTVDDLEFVKCPDWKVRQTICDLMVAATKKREETT